MADRDRISKLPDEVLCHILSFLPTEDAAATIVLSKRWKPLWSSMSTLDFDSNRYKKSKSKSNSSFIKFVYAAILSRDLLQPIQNFSLICTKCPDSDVKVWLNAAIQRQLENLEINLSYSQVPCSVLRCKTLVVLNLDYVSFDNFSSVVDLPSLKTLHLENVEVLKPQWLMDLLYGCPVLEDLEIGDVFGDWEMEDIDLNFEGEVKILSNLVRAEINFPSAFNIPVKAFCNAQFLALHLYKCDADIPVFPNLTYLELSYVKWSSALDMLNHCPKLQTVVFDIPNTINNDDKEVWPDPGFVPECFSLHLRKCFIYGYAGTDCQMRFARYVLQNSTSLCTMAIHRWYSNHRKKLEVMTELASYPRSSAVCELVLFK